jgi:hypothetical protein
MEANFWLIILPAVLALVFKGGIYAYAHFSRTHNLQTRLYLFALFALSVQNIAEISHFHTLLVQDQMPDLDVTVFYAASIAALAFFLHLAITIASERPSRHISIGVFTVYLFAVVLELLLFFTPWLIVGYTRIGDSLTGYSVTRVPGQLYGIFELYVVGGIASIIGLLILSAYRIGNAYRRSKATVTLIAILPMAITAITVIVSLRLGQRIFNASVLMPLSITFFLVVSAYAIHQHRLFDIEFFIPWSKVRKRKTAFYRRIRSTISEIADLGSVNQVIQRLGETLRCPVALVGMPRPVLAGASGTMGEFPREMLAKFDSIVVANEIADRKPDTYRLMKQHGVAAVVPFFPHSQNTAGWLLLGDGFSEEVYSPLDFKMVEQLFDKIGEVFLDKLLLMRTQLADAQRSRRALESRVETLERNVEVLNGENRALREENRRLLEGSVAAAREVVQGDGDTGPAMAPVESSKSLDEYVSEFEAQIIRQALEACDGNKSKAARLLGLRPNTLHYKLERYGLSGAGKDRPH